MMICAECRWYRTMNDDQIRVNDVKQGVCHRYPPTLFMTPVAKQGRPSIAAPNQPTMQIEAHWNAGRVIVKAEDFCGEFERPAALNYGGPETR